MADDIGRTRVRHNATLGGLRKPLPSMLLATSTSTKFAGFLLYWAASCVALAIAFAVYMLVFKAQIQRWSSVDGYAFSLVLILFRSPFPAAGVALSMLLLPPVGSAKERVFKVVCIWFGALIAVPLFMLQQAPPWYGLLGGNVSDFIAVPIIAASAHYVSVYFALASRWASRKNAKACAGCGYILAPGAPACCPECGRLPSD